jgi:hypothetical protein
MDRSTGCRCTQHCQRSHPAKVKRTTRPFAVGARYSISRLRCHTIPRRSWTSKSCTRHPAESERTARPYEALSSACISLRLPDKGAVFSRGAGRSLRFQISVPCFLLPALRLRLAAHGLPLSAPLTLTPAFPTVFICVICGPSPGRAGALRPSSRSWRLRGSQSHGVPHGTPVKPTGQPLEVPTRASPVPRRSTPSRRQCSASRPP